MTVSSSAQAPIRTATSEAAAAISSAPATSAATGAHSAAAIRRAATESVSARRRRRARRAGQPRARSTATGSAALRAGVLAEPLIDVGEPADLAAEADRPGGVAALEGALGAVVDGLLERLVVERLLDRRGGQMRADVIDERRVVDDALGGEELVPRPLKVAGVDRRVGLDDETAGAAHVLAVRADREDRGDEDDHHGAPGER